MSNSFEISEEVTLMMSRALRRAELERLNRELAALDEKALCLDPDQEYRSEVKASILAETETTEWRVAA